MTVKFCVIPGDCYVKAIGQRNIGGEHKTDTACPWADTGADRSQIASAGFPFEPQYLLAYRDGAGEYLCK